jgi:long-chain alkane monooxygenase
VTASVRARPSSSTSHSAAEVTADIRRRAVAQDRQADDILFIQGLTFVVGDTETAALARSAEIDEWFSDEAMLAHMSGTIGVDFAAIDLDRPIGDFTIERI